MRKRFDPTLLWDAPFLRKSKFTFPELLKVKVNLKTLNQYVRKARSAVKFRYKKVDS